MSELSSTCSSCNKNFKTRTSLLRHQRSGKNCKSPSLKRKNDAANDVNLHDKKPWKYIKLEEAEIPEFGTYLLKKKTALKDHLLSYEILNVSSEVTIENFFKSIDHIIFKLISSIVLRNNCVKVNFVLCCTYINIDSEITERCFKTKNVVVLQTTDFNELLYNTVLKLLREADESSAKGSGWSMYSIDYLKVNLNKCFFMGGGCFLELPKFIKNKKAVVNPKIADSRCFLYSILAFFINTNYNRKKCYEKYEKLYDWTGISFPTNLNEIKGFEKRNNVSVNLYSINERNKIYPMRISNIINPDRHHDLLYLKSENGKGHFSCIKNLESLVSKQINKSNGKKLICRRCFSHFYKSKDLLMHNRNCEVHKYTRIEMPKVDQHGVKPHIKFKNIQHQLKVKFVAYCDIESMLLPLHSCRNNPELSHTQPTHLHQAIAFCFYVCSSLPDKILRQFKIPLKPIRYVGADAMKKFITCCENIAKRVSQCYKLNIPMPKFNLLQELQFASEISCGVCGETLKPGDKRCREHDHSTGQYRYLIHDRCNLIFRNPTFLPIYLHNNMYYDSKFIIPELFSSPGGVNVIPHSIENYLCYNKQIGDISLRFLDTFRFLSTSLENLVSYLPPDAFKIIEKFFGNKTNLLLSKGVFPYDYISSIDILKENKLPAIESFYNSLIEENISKESYLHACEVWDKFKVKNLLEYLKLYVTSDTLQLACVYQNFREICMNNFNLDPVWYYSAPGLSFDAALSITKIRLELLTDYEMLLFIERSIRGGMNFCNTKKAVAKNSYLDPNHSGPSNFILYFDVNGLYSHSMKLFLPTSNFRWANVKRFTAEYILNLKDDSSRGYFLEVDMEYHKKTA